MRKAISIGLIFVLSAQCLYQLGIVTYFQLNRGYIAQVLCINRENPMTMCYGNCFLNRNLKLAGETEKSGVPPVNKVKLEIPSFIISEDNYSFNQLGIVQALSCPDYSYKALSGFPNAIFHPPAILA